MLPLRVAELAKLTKGRLITGSSQIWVRNVSIDTRSIKPGDLFIPIRGENFDGHQFIAEAMSKGACGFLAMERQMTKIFLEGQSPRNQEKLVVLAVEDTLAALQALAKGLRKKLEVAVVGVSGSTGKTTVKNILKSILSRKFNTLCSPRNYNNEIGVPLTLIEADDKSEVLIVEMAMRGLGQIGELAQIARPEIGLITNVGDSHFEFLGSQEKIAEAKSELIKEIPKEGAVVLNADDQWTNRFIPLASAKVITYGKSPKADFRAENISINSLGRPSFKIVSENVSIPAVKLPFPGRHNIYNALGACAVASYLGVSPSLVKEELSQCQLPKMRMQLLKGSQGLLIINDTYNSSPASMRAALETLKDISTNSHQSVAVLGDMLELGSITEEAHLRVGEQIKEKKVGLLVAIGERGKLIATGALGAGMDKDRVFKCSSIDHAKEILRKKVKPKDVVLVKASRKMELEKIANWLSTLSLNAKFKMQIEKGKTGEKF